MVDGVIQIARTAGKLLAEGFTSPKKVDHKGRIDLVTQYDVMVENVIKELLAKEFPEFQIIAEESDRGEARSGQRIYVDPIDGTTNFVHGFPFCAVSIGVWNGDTPIAGVVHNPVLNETFWAEKGKGAFCNGEPIRVTEAALAGESLLATGFPYASATDETVRAQVLGLMEKALKTTRGMRRAGSAALDLAYVAKGVFDGFFEMHLKSWDVAAGICLVEESGGKVTTLSGEPYGIDGGEIIVATNGRIHDELLAILNG